MRLSTVHQIVSEFEAAATPAIAPEMASYMKNVSPFLGLKTPERRAILKPIFKQLGKPSETDIHSLVDALYRLPEREFKYAACDALAHFQKSIPPDWIDTYIREWLIIEPWWDTIDSLVNGIVGPLTLREPSLEPVMWTWLHSDNMWLQRAAIGHQRGRRSKTDVALQLRYCHEVAADSRFFIAKAVGWALRDLAAIDLPATKQFMAEHPNLPRVAAREAIRGIERAERT